MNVYSIQSSSSPESFKDYKNSAKKSIEKTIGLIEETVSVLRDNLDFLQKFWNLTVLRTGEELNELKESFEKIKKNLDELPDFFEKEINNLKKFIEIDQKYDEKLIKKYEEAVKLIESIGGGFVSVT